MQVNDVYRHFIIASLWASNNYDAEDECSLEDDYSITDISKKSERELKRRIGLFLKENKKTISKLKIPEEMVGHDLFLTSRHHGAGFWDRGYGRLGNALSESSHEHFNSDPPEVGDDGKIHFTEEYSVAKKISSRRTRTNPYARLSPLPYKCTECRQQIGYCISCERKFKQDEHIFCLMETPRGHPHPYASHYHFKCAKKEGLM